MGGRELVNKTTPSPSPLPEASPALPEATPPPLTPEAPAGVTIPLLDYIWPAMLGLGLAIVVIGLVKAYVARKERVVKKCEGMTWEEVLAQIEQEQLVDYVFRHHQMRQMFISRVQNELNMTVRPLLIQVFRELFKRDWREIITFIVLGAAAGAGIGFMISEAFFE